jgi:hypothetical protein
VANKQPFERILSLVDRKKFFLKLVVDRSPVIVKFADGMLLSFRGLQVSKEGHLDGLANAKAMGSAKQRTVVVFFYSGRDRYFLNTKMVRMPTGIWRIMNSTDFYRLNRRESHRTVIPDSVSISLYVTSIAGHKARVQARVTDFSAMGARVRWASGQYINKGAIIRGSLIWLKGKEFPIYAAIKHRTKEGSVGIEFTNMDSVQANRLKILSIELQQLVNYL